MACREGGWWWRRQSYQRLVSLRQRNVVERRCLWEHRLKHRFIAIDQLFPLSQVRAARRFEPHRRPDCRLRGSRQFWTGMIGNSPSSPPSSPETSGQTHPPYKRESACVIPPNSPFPQSKGIRASHNGSKYRRMGTRKVSYSSACHAVRHRCQGDHVFR